MDQEFLETHLRMITGQARLPDNMAVVDTCKHRHGLNGKTVRYKLHRQCVFCQHEATMRKKAKLRAKRPKEKSGPKCKTKPVNKKATLFDSPLWRLPMKPSPLAIRLYQEGRLLP